MSEHPNRSEENDPVRNELRGLPKLRAPWYFEAKLQQQIRARGERGSNWFIARPLPAFALSLGVFLFVCVTGYYMFFDSPGVEQQDISPIDREVSNPVDHDVPVEPFHNPEPEPPSVSPSRSSGPSEPGFETTIESGVSGESDLPGKTQYNNKPVVIFQGQSSNSALKFKADNPNKSNLGIVDSLDGKSTDSTKGNLDSLGKSK